MRRELETIAREAGDLALACFGDKALRVEAKGPLDLVSQALVGTELEFRAQAQWGWGFDDVQWTGVDPQGRNFIMRGDQTLHGGGARATVDGIDVANIAGSTILVMRAGVHTERNIDESLKKLRRARARIIGSVMNAMQIKRGGRYGSYDYAYAHTYTVAMPTDEPKDE